MNVVGSEIAVSEAAVTPEQEAEQIRTDVSREEEFHTRLIEWTDDELARRQSRVLQITCRYEKIAATREGERVAFGVHGLQRVLKDQKLLVGRLERAADGLREDKRLMDLVGMAATFGDVYVGGGVVAAAEMGDSHFSDVDMLVDLDVKAFGEMANLCREWAKKNDCTFRAEENCRVRIFGQDGSELYMIASVLPMVKAVYTIAALSGEELDPEVGSHMDCFVSYWAGYESEQMFLRFRKDDEAREGLDSRVVGIDGMVGKTYYGVRNPKALIYTNYYIIGLLRERGYEVAAKFVEERYYKDMVNLVKNWRRGRWMIGSSMLFDGVDSAKLALGELAAGSGRVPEWFGEKLAENLCQSLGTGGVGGVMVGLTEFPLVVAYSQTFFRELGFRVEDLEQHDREPIHFVERLKSDLPCLDRAISFRRLVLGGEGGNGGLYQHEQCRDLSEFFAVMSFCCLSQEAIYEMGEELAVKLPSSAVFDQAKFYDLALSLRRASVPLRRVEAEERETLKDFDRHGERCTRAARKVSKEIRRSPWWRKYHP